MRDYNGLKNRQTWSVAVSICHDKGLYDLAKNPRGNYEK